MIRKACIMKVFSDCHEAYKKRHDEIWPEMIKLIKEYGGHNYSIYLDAKTNLLFAYLEIEDEEKWNQSAEAEVCRKWWAYMKDVMETNPDNSPLTVDLKEVFYQK